MSHLDDDVFASSDEEVWALFGDIVQSSSSVVIADYTTKLTTVGDCFVKNKHFMIV